MIGVGCQTVYEIDPWWFNFGVKVYLAVKILLQILSVSPVGTQILGGRVSLRPVKRDCLAQSASDLAKRNRNMD